MQSIQPRAGEWSVDIRQDGRNGTILYRESSGCLSCYWEFGGDDGVAIIDVGDEATWIREHAWAAPRRVEILGRIADQVIRQKAPGCGAEIDDRKGCIRLRPNLPQRPPPIPGPRSLNARKQTVMLIFSMMLLLLAVVAVGAKNLFSIRSPHGSPIGSSVRVGQQIATLIQTLEPYVPSLHRNPDNDRYRVGLFLQPVDGRGRGRMIPIGKGFHAQDLSFMRLTGIDGDLLWCSVKGIDGVNLQTGKIIAAGTGTPTAQQTSAIITHNGLPFEAKPEHFLSAGARPTPTEWLGLHSQREAEKDFKAGSWLRPSKDAESAKEMRHFHRGELGPTRARSNREILSLARLSEDGYFNGGFIRAAPDADPIRLSGPDGFLIASTSDPGMRATLVVARVDTAGKPLWKVDTGIDHFHVWQILPDARFPGFVGTRPPVPGKVSEPLLVIVDTQSGTASTTSLWQ